MATRTALSSIVVVDLLASPGGGRRGRREVQLDGGEGSRRRLLPGDGREDRPEPLQGPLVPGGSPPEGGQDLGGHADLDGWHTSMLAPSFQEAPRAPIPHVARSLRPFCSILYIRRRRGILRSRPADKDHAYRAPHSGPAPGVHSAMRPAASDLVDLPCQHAPAGSVHPARRDSGRR